MKRAERDLPETVIEALKVLDLHYDAFYKALEFAKKAQHPVPCDTKAWSQILVSILTGNYGRARKKGSDLSDGSDVKAANCWTAIDTPRFNGCIPSGRLSKKSQKPADVSALDDIPYIFFVLWDEKRPEKLPRCRIWVVRANSDLVFRGVCDKWYRLRKEGRIISTNFQLHPPRNLDADIIRNECGNMSFPLLFSANRRGEHFEMDQYNPSFMVKGECRPV